MKNISPFIIGLILILGSFMLGFIFNFAGYENKTVITITMFIYWIIILFIGIKQFKKENI
jgi:hypothetical protein